MGLRISWTSQAKFNFEQILQYISGKFGSLAALSYFQKVEGTIKILSTFPKLGTLQIGEENLHALILYKRTTIFYTFSENELKIVNVVDNRWKKKIKH